MRKTISDTISHLELHFNYLSLSSVTPPGSLTQILPHPAYFERHSLELSIFNQHRFAFFFWNKWTQEYVVKQDLIRKPPCLITLDWHRDLVWPVETEKDWLKKLDLANNRDVALYAWANLGTLDDQHIMAAAYLNLIGDIYVHCRQAPNDDWTDDHFEDKYRNIHTVKKFKDFEALENHMLKSDEENVYFDIDLDFFTIDNPLNSGSTKENYTYLTDTKIREMLRPDRPLIAWIFQRLWGFTIALEPQHSGGFLESQRLLALIDQLYFEPSLFVVFPSNWEKSTRWKHLSI